MVSPSNNRSLFTYQYIEMQPFFPFNLVTADKAYDCWKHSHNAVEPQEEITTIQDEQRREVP